jgi:hypothetical protein
MKSSRQSSTEVKLPKISNPMTSLHRACAADIFEMTGGTGADVIGVSAGMNTSSEQFSNLPS